MNIIEKLLEKQFGFIANNEELLEVIADNPNHEVLIRANLNRVVVKAFQVVTKMKEINAEENNYVRDISVGFSRV